MDEIRSYKLPGSRLAVEFTDKLLPSLNFPLWVLAGSYLLLILRNQGFL